MCCFSGPVEYVVGTRLFARALPAGRQALIYAMTLSAREDVAMVLPIPTPPKSADDAVTFVSLAAYPTLFDDLDRAFPMPVAAGLPSFGAPRAQGKPVLVVHDVGAYEASFVPTLPDFERLDRRFRLQPSVWDALPAYRDYGFAVFKLKGLSRGVVDKLLGKTPPRTEFHPMAFTFPSRAPESLFFPTVHVHDGAVHPQALFDHILYAQTPDGTSLTREAWEAGEGPGALHVAMDRAQGLVDAEQRLYRRRLVGMAPNRDVVVRAA